MPAGRAWRENRRRGGSGLDGRRRTRGTESDEEGGDEGGEGEEGGEEEEDGSDEEEAVGEQTLAQAVGERGEGVLRDVVDELHEDEDGPDRAEAGELKGVPECGIMGEDGPAEEGVEDV